MTQRNDPVQAQLVRARRDQILDAATTLFAERGFRRATVRAIAQEAGVADGTIYNYFGGKDDLLIGILDRLNETEARDEQFAAGSEMALRDFFEQYIGRRMVLMQENAEVLRALLPEVLVNPSLRERYVTQVTAPTLAVGERFFGAMAAEGEIRPLNPALVTRVIGGTVFGLLLMRLLGDETLEQEWEHALALVTDLLLAGLLPEERS